MSESTTWKTVQWALDLEDTTSTSTINEIAWRRDQMSVAAGFVEDKHHEATHYDLDQRVAVRARQSVPTLLGELADSGLAWSFIARLAGVSVAAVRKWRNDGGTTPESREHLARLAAFLDLLSELGIEDPAQWLEMRFGLGSGYTIAPIDLYLRGAYAGLLDIASWRQTPEQVLDKEIPDWRTGRSHFEVYEDGDGQPSIRHRVEE